MFSGVERGALGTELKHRNSKQLLSEYDEGITKRFSILLDYNYLWLNYLWVMVLISSNFTAAENYIFLVTKMVKFKLDGNSDC